MAEETVPEVHEEAAEKSEVVSVEPTHAAQEETSVVEPTQAPVLHISGSSFRNGVVSITKEESVPATPMPTPVATQLPNESQVPTLIVETEPSVSFTNMDTIFDSDNPERNEIAETFSGDIETIETLNVPPEEMDGCEELA